MLLHQPSKCTKIIIEVKDKELAKLISKLDNLDTAPKIYWSVINKFLTTKRYLFKNILPYNFIWLKMKVPYQTLLSSQYHIIKKAELFNNQFTSQFSLVKNQSTLSNLEYKTEND